MNPVSVVGSLPVDKAVLFVSTFTCKGSESINLEEHNPQWYIYRFTKPPVWLECRRRAQCELLRYIDVVHDVVNDTVTLRVETLQHEAAFN